VYHPEALKKTQVKAEDGSAPEEQIPNHEADSLFNLAFDPSYPFGSQTANLEYSILSAILGNPGLEPPSIGDLNSPLQASTLRTQGPPSPPPSNGSPDAPEDAADLPIPQPHFGAPPPPPPQQSESSIMPKDTSVGSRPPKTSPGDRVYSSVQKGYDYTQGYHFLMRYLSERSDLSISKA
jgi:transcription activator of gluconeogenesis